MFVFVLKSAKQPVSLSCFAMACQIFAFKCSVCNVRLCSNLVTKLWRSVDASSVLCCIYLVFSNTSPAAASILSSLKSTHNSSTVVCWWNGLLSYSTEVNTSAKKMRHTSSSVCRRTSWSPNRLPTRSTWLLSCRLNSITQQVYTVHVNTLIVVVLTSFEVDNFAMRSNASHLIAM